MGDCLSPKPPRQELVPGPFCFGGVGIFGIFSESSCSNTRHEGFDF